MPLGRSLRRKLVRKMMQVGVIEPSKSSYAAPVVIVKKKSGEHRFCTDYRRLNNVIKPDMEAMPNIEDLFATISSQANRYFSKIDVSKGYWQIKMSDRMREVTAFTTTMGLFQWKVMPFGLNVAPATFTRMMRKLLDGMKNVASFMDDILIFSETREEHMALPGSSADAPLECTTSETFSPRTVLTENICRCVLHILQHFPTTMAFLTTSTITLSYLDSAPLQAES